MRSSRLFLAVLFLMAASFSNAGDPAEDPTSTEPTDEPSTETTTESVPQPPPPVTDKGADWKIDGEQLKKVVSTDQSGMHFGVHELNGKSFRIRLGTPEECSKVIVCVGKVTLNSDSPPNYNQTTHCLHPITFNLKERTVEVNSVIHPFASSVADFYAVYSTKGAMNLKLPQEIKGSNTADLTETMIATNWEMQDYGSLTVMGSGYSCPGIVNTFSRHDHTRYYLKDKQEATHTGTTGGTPSQTKVAAPLHGGKPGTKETNVSPAAIECQNSILGETGVAGSGDWIKVGLGAAKAFKYTVGVATGTKFTGNSKAPLKLHLEIRKPLECDWIRLCFKGDNGLCDEPERILDLIMRHRFFVQPDFERGRIFDMPVKEMDVFTLNIQPDLNRVYLETRPSEHGQPLKEHMALHWDITQQKYQQIAVLASRCEFRLTKAKSPIDMEQSWGDTDVFKRNNGFITSCVELTQ